MHQIQITTSNINNIFLTVIRDIWRKFPYMLLLVPDMPLLVLDMLLLVSDIQLKLTDICCVIAVICLSGVIENLISESPGIFSFLFSIAEYYIYICT